MFTDSHTDNAADHRITIRVKVGEGNRCQIGALRHWACGEAYGAEVSYIMIDLSQIGDRDLQLIRDVLESMGLEEELATLNDEILLRVQLRVQSWAGAR